MERSRKIVIIVIIIGIVGAVGYWQYTAALQIGVLITKSTLLEEDSTSDQEARYSLEIEFNNPSMLYLTAGETEFSIYLDGQKIGDGTLAPFVLPALTTITTEGIFQTNKQLQDTSNNTPEVKIMGATKYNMLITSIEIPFVFYPTQDQAREFIRQN